MAVIIVMIVVGMMIVQFPIRHNFMIAYVAIQQQHRTGMMIVSLLLTRALQRDDSFQIYIHALLGFVPP
jgi:hypothetical protein